MSPKIKMRRSVGRNRDLEGKQQAIEILRNVTDEEAFYFYENIGNPTGESAKSLSEFISVIDVVKLESLLFHLKRKDFQKWFKETLGDPELAKRMGRIASSNDKKLRTKIHAIVENRLQELRDTFITIAVSEELTIKK